MKNKYILFLVAALSFFTLSRAQETTPTTTVQPQRNLVFGVRANVALVGIHRNREGDGGNTIVQNDYSLFIQYKSIGIFGGYTGIFNYNNYSTTHANVGLGGFNAGLMFRLYNSRDDHHAFSFYLYDVRYSGTNPNFPVGQPQSPNYLNVYYKEGMNFFTINPRYRYTFCKGLLSAEFGLLYGTHLHDIKYMQDPNSTHFLSYNNRLFAFAVMGGANLSLSFNPSAFIPKKQ